MGELVEEAVSRQTHFHGNAQMEQSGVFEPEAIH
jgi:hypothetical protein